MGIDIHLEADKLLSIIAISTTLSELDALGIASDDTRAEGFFDSGLSVYATCEFHDQTLYTEDTKGMDFPVAVRCYLRIKGPEPEGSSALSDLGKFIKLIAAKTDARFVVSLQHESTLYWKNNDGLHAA
ncbi:hypothetical protein [Xanthomonas sp. LMG 9002]|uniref:hypothetical protein n=1 Tax=Xanthomonas sp. LMG 9002 TaxID=1591158 RepID=UPI00136CA8EE|nr:hypothetical protein [Xanthomonas sp. LMG 9002]